MRWRRVTAAVAAVVVVPVVVAAVLWGAPVLTVHQVEVTGVVNSDPSAVTAAVGAPEGSNLLRVDTGAAAHRVAELPWVERATVDRHFPDTLQVTVTEHQAVLYVRRDDGLHLFDGDGTEFLVTGEAHGARELTGAASGEPQAVQAVLDITGALPDELLGQVSRVSVPGVREITLELADGRSVYWGSTDHLGDKALAMATVLGREGQHWNISDPYMPSVR